MKLIPGAQPLYEISAMEKSLKALAQRITGSKKLAFPTTPSIKSSPVNVASRPQRQTRGAAVIVSDDGNSIPFTTYKMLIYVADDDHKLVNGQEGRRATTRRSSNKHISYVEDSGKKFVFRVLILIILSCQIQTMCRTLMSLLSIASRRRIRNVAHPHRDGLPLLKRVVRRYDLFGVLL